MKRTAQQRGKRIDEEEEDEDDSPVKPAGRQAKKAKTSGAHLFHLCLEHVQLCALVHGASHSLQRDADVEHQHYFVVMQNLAGVCRAIPSDIAFEPCCCKGYSRFVDQMQRQEKQWSMHLHG